jgi:uncharacterized membrane protein
MAVPNACASAAVLPLLSLLPLLKYLSISPALPAYCWLIAIASAFVSTLRISALIVLRSFPAISGDDVTDHIVK